AARAGRRCGPGKAISRNDNRFFATSGPQLSPHKPCTSGLSPKLPFCSISNVGSLTYAERMTRHDLANLTPVPPLHRMERGAGGRGPRPPPATNPGNEPTTSNLISGLLLRACAVALAAWLV